MGEKSSSTKRERPTPTCPRCKSAYVKLEWSPLYRCTDCGKLFEAVS